MLILTTLIAIYLSVVLLTFGVNVVLMFDFKGKYECTRHEFWLDKYRNHKHLALTAYAWPVQIVRLFCKGFRDPVK